MISQDESQVNGRGDDLRPTHSQGMWDYFRDANNWLCLRRSDLGSVKEIGIRRGLNLSIINNSSCYAEAQIEQLVGFLMNHAGRDPREDPIASSALRHVRTLAVAEIKLGPLELVYPILFGKGPAEVLQDPVLWESVVGLFALRDVLSHGRAVQHKLNWPNESGSSIEADLQNKYRKAETLLLKRKIIKAPVFDLMQKHESDGFLSDEVADFFWKTSRDFVACLFRTVPAPFSEIGRVLGSNL